MLPLFVYKKLKSNQKALTITEIMVSVIILSVIAAFAIPNFVKSIRKNHIRTANFNLIALHSAQQAYRARHSTFYDFDGSETLATANSIFSLNISDTDHNYLFSGNTTSFTIIARPSDSAYDLTLTQATIGPTNPQCTGSCP